MLTSHIVSMESWSITSFSARSSAFFLQALQVNAGTQTGTHVPRPSSSFFCRMKMHHHTLLSCISCRLGTLYPDLQKFAGSVGLLLKDTACYCLDPLRKLDATGTKWLFLALIEFYSLYDGFNKLSSVDQSNNKSKQ
jgi:hypothetical protein